MKKHGFNVDDKVKILEDGLDYRDFGGIDRRGEIGVITEIHNYPDGCEPTIEVDFNDCEETDCFYYYDIELLG